MKLNTNKKGNEMEVKIWEVEWTACYNCKNGYNVSGGPAVIAEDNFGNQMIIHYGPAFKYDTREEALDVAREHKEELEKF